MTARLIIQDDFDPAVHHIIRGSQEGLDHVRKGVQARINTKALNIALEVSGRALVAEMERSAALRTQLAQMEHLMEAKAQ